MHYCTIFSQYIMATMMPLFSLQQLFFNYLHNVELEDKINHQVCFPDAYLVCNQLISVNVKEEGKWLCGLQNLRSRDMSYFIVTEQIETLCPVPEILHLGATQETS